MRRYAWVFNLDAELELLRGRPGYVPQRKLLAQLAEHGQSSRALMAETDVELGRGSTVPAGRHGRAWCPTPMALALMQAHGVEPEPHPAASVLRRVNHRLFAHELGGGLPQQAYVRSREQLLGVLGAYHRHWLMKRPLGFAGRGQLRAIGPLTEKQWTWVDASLEREGILVEPLVRPSFEVSLHGFVWRDGEYELGRVCAQQISERGAFRGVRLAQADELSPGETEALFERAHAVAQALRAAGYFGPFGIDGYRYEAGFCALGEINARYTLGFATGFPRRPSELSL
jgi:phosphoribosylaminoimidazole carboxylase (NCAIR synthetase)